MNKITMKEENFALVFDNGGGCTAYFGDEFAHHYDDMSQLVTDFKAYANDGTTEDWEGNEIEDHGEFDYNSEDERNGGIKVYTGLRHFPSKEELEDETWGNVSSFFEELFDLTDITELGREIVDGWLST